MGWTEAKEAADAIKSNYLKIESGGKEEVCFLGEPDYSVSCFDSATNTRVKYNPKEHDNDPRFRVVSRWSFNVAVLPTLDVQVFECGVTLFREIQAEHEKGRLSKYTYEISRQGEGKNTRWKITRENELNEKQRAKLESLELHKLGVKNDEDDMPF